MITEVDLDIQAAARGSPGTVSLTNLFETLHPRLIPSGFCSKKIMCFTTITCGVITKIVLEILQLLSPSLYKNIHLLLKIWPSSPNFLQPFPPKSKLHEPVKHFILFIISIYLMGSGLSHSNTVHLIVSLSKINYPIYQEDENSPLPQKCS